MRIGVTERGDAGLDLSWRQFVTDSKVDGAILITKRPSALVPILVGMSLPSNIIVHCTITGLPKSIEPNVNSTEKELEAYHELVKLLGPTRAVLRIDPIIPGFISHLPSLAKEAEGRVRISFLDLYDHVRRRFTEANIDPKQTTFHAPLDTRKDLFHLIERNSVKVPEVCGEPDFDCTGCVSQTDLLAMGLSGRVTPGGQQRKACACAGEKFEMLVNRAPCPHKCLYCYWRS